MVICQGCGQSVDLPEGYTRNKIQCPGCGVICPVPAGAAERKQPARAGSASPSRGSPAAEPAGEPLEDQAIGFLREPDPAPLFDGEPAPPPPPSPPPSAPPGRRPAEAAVFCRRCGAKIRRQRECPSCDNAEGDAPLPVEPAGGPPSMELDEPPRRTADDEDDDSPYLVAGGDLPTCPRCRKDMAPGGVFCTSCGFDTRTRKKAARVYEPISRSWDADMRLETRLLFFGGGLAGFVFLGVLGVTAGASVSTFLTTGLPVAGLLAFILGTYDRITITRDRRGRARVHKHWRFAFIPLKPTETEVVGFEGVTTGPWMEVNFWDWLIFGSLLLSGIVPGLIWYFQVIHKPFFHVALAQDHGHPEVYVYRGRSQDQMNDIADTLCAASGLRRLA